LKSFGLSKQSQLQPELYEKTKWSASNKSLTVTINDVYGSILLAINPQLAINDTEIVLCDQRMQ